MLKSPCQNGQSGSRVLGWCQNNYPCCSCSEYNKEIIIPTWKNINNGISRGRGRGKLSSVGIMIPASMDKESNVSTSVRVDHHYSYSRFQDKDILKNKKDSVNAGGEGWSTTTVNHNVHTKTNFNRGRVFNQPIDPHSKLNRKSDNSNKRRSYTEVLMGKRTDSVLKSIPLKPII